MTLFLQKLSLFQLRIIIAYLQKIVFSETFGIIFSTQLPKFSTLFTGKRILLQLTF